MSILSVINSVQGSMLSGFFSGALLRYMDQKHEERLAAMKADDKSVSEARMTKSGAMLFLMSFVTIFACVAFFSKPFVAAYMHWPFWMAYDESHGWIVAPFKGNNSTVMRAYVGLVNSPMDNQVMLYILTLLFGRMRVSRMK